MNKPIKSQYERYKDQIRSEYKSLHPDYLKISNSILSQYKFGCMAEQEVSNLCNAILWLMYKDMYIDRQGNFRYTDDQIYDI